MKIAIAGAGIGGLTAALCLNEKGFEVRIFEAAETLQPLGVGINVMPHASGVLHGLGLGDPLDEMAIRTRAIEYRTRFGHLIQSDPRSVEAGFNYPQYSVHRGELQFLLLDTVRSRLGPDAVALGRAISGFTQDERGVHVRFADGTAYDADLLIGAEGFRSKVRQQLHPGEGPAHYEGTMMWRGTNLQAPFGDGRTMFIAGDHDVKFVCYPISSRAARDGKALINWVAEVRHDQPRAADEADWSREGDRDFISEFLGLPDAGHRHPSPAEEHPEDHPVSDDRSRPAAVVDARAGHPSRRRRPSDVPDGSERGLAGDHRREGSCGLAGRAAGTGRPARL